MSKNVALSGQEQSPDEIWSWYQLQNALLEQYKIKVLRGNPLDNLEVVGEQHWIVFQNKENVFLYFLEAAQKLESMVSLALLAAIEAMLMVHCYELIQQKKKSPLARKFRDLYHKSNVPRLSLEQHIVPIWKEILDNNQNKKVFSDLLGFLNYRHWLAHGRYWRAQLPSKYIQPDDVYILAKSIETILDKYSQF